MMIQKKVIKRWDLGLSSVGRSSFPRRGKGWRGRGGERTGGASVEKQ
jgi:hypothetical protein